MPKSSYSVDLIKQMAECDANYIRLLKLVPHLQAYRDKSFVEIAMLNNTGREKGIIEQLESSDEPEKLLEGLFVEFCIADETSFGGRITVEIEIVEAFKYTTTLEIRQFAFITMQVLLRLYPIKGIETSSQDMSSQMHTCIIRMRRCKWTCSLVNG